MLTSIGHPVHMEPWGSKNVWWLGALPQQVSWRHGCWCPKMWSTRWTRQWCQSSTRRGLLSWAMGHTTCTWGLPQWKCMGHPHISGNSCHWRIFLFLQLLPLQRGHEWRLLNFFWCWFILAQALFHWFQCKCIFRNIEAKSFMSIKYSHHVLLFWGVCLWLSCQAITGQRMFLVIFLRVALLVIIKVMSFLGRRATQLFLWSSLSKGFLDTWDRISKKAFQFLGGSSWKINMGAN